MSPTWASSSTALRGGETRDGVAISCFPKHGLPTLRASGIDKACVITQDDTRLRTQAERGNLRNERLESLPERGEFMGFAGVQREHGVVVGARFLDVRQFRHEEAEVHDISPSVWLNAVRGKPTDTGVRRTGRARRADYPLPHGKGKIGGHMG